MDVRVPGVKRGYVDSEDGQIHYRESGSGSPLILLHLNPASSQTWEAVLPRFAARGYHAVAFDTPGYGNSDRPAVRPDMDGYARRIAGAATSFGFDQFDLIGHHTGGTIGSVLAANNPERVRQLVVWGYANFTTEMMGTLAKTPEGIYSADGHELLEKWRARWKLDDPDYPSDRNRLRIVDQLLAGKEYGWGLHALAAVDHVALAERIQTLTLLICGERDTLFNETKHAQTLFPNAKWIPIHGASGDVADEYPEEFVVAVDEFLRAGTR